MPPTDAELRWHIPWPSRAFRQLACNLFLPARSSNDYTQFVAPQTTGRMTVLLNGRSSGGTGPDDDKKEAFDDMQRSVEALGAGDSVFLAAWLFFPDLPLTATSPAGLTTWGELFQSKAKIGVKVRILMSDFTPFPPAASFLYDSVHNVNVPALDKLIDGLAPGARDNLKYAVSAHTPTYLTIRVGVHHEKFMVICRKGAAATAYCGGLDLAAIRTPPYWSYAQIPFGWHDVHVRLEGAITRHLLREFVWRWNLEAPHSTTAPRPGWRPLSETLAEPPATPGDRDPARNSQRMQMLRTVSVQGSGFNVQQTRRDDIWQAYLQLVGCANKFLYMENQYFREPRLADAIVQRAKAQKELIVLICVPKELDDDPNLLLAHGLALQNEFFTRLFAGVPASRLRVYTMYKRYLHSKLIMADDRALSVGSANANPRGFQMDTELNVLVDDAAAATTCRRRLWAHNLGTSEATVAGWAVPSFFSKWDAVAASNVKLTKKPQDMAGEGVVPFDPRTLTGTKHKIPDVLTELAQS